MTCVTCCDPSLSSQARSQPPRAGSKSRSTHRTRPSTVAALKGLVDDLNDLGATFPGTDVPVRYRVAVHHSGVVA